MKTLIEQLKAARAVSTPLIAITTPDQPAIAQEITKELNGDTPVIQWDRARGLAPRNTEGTEALKKMLAEMKRLGLGEVTLADLGFASVEPAAAMRMAIYLPKHTILVAMSIDRFLREEQPGATIQAILNLRDTNKAEHRTLILLSPAFNFPSELQHDVILLDDPLPTNEGYAVLAEELHKSADLKKPDAKHVSDITRAVRGLSSFEADQVLAMSLALNDGKGIALDSAWELKKSAVGKVSGLTMTLDGPDLSELRGLDNAIKILNDLWLGPEPPELVVRVDEMDKSFAGLGQNGGPGDNTGIAQDFHQQFLVNMEDNGWLGALLFGVRGGGKTVLTQSIGKAHGIPTIAMDTGQMKAGIHGQSEQHIRDAFRTMKSIGGKRVIVLATCNRMDVFPSELLRRFKLGVLYFDLLTAEERKALWPIYLKKFGQPLNSALPDDTGWTGAEIRNACELAYMLRRPVADVGKTMIVPYTKSNPKALDSLREQADGKYVSASYAGAYQKANAATEIIEVGPRTMTFSKTAN